MSESLYLRIAEGSTLPEGKLEAVDIDGNVVVRGRLAITREGLSTFAKPPVSFVVDAED